MARGRSTMLGWKCAVFFIQMWYSKGGLCKAVNCFQHISKRRKVVSITGQVNRENRIQQGTTFIRLCDCQKIYYPALRLCSFPSQTLSSNFCPFINWESGKFVTPEIATALFALTMMRWYHWYLDHATAKPSKLQTSKKCCRFLFLNLCTWNGG